MPDPAHPEGAARRLAAVAAGHRADLSAARQALSDPDPAVRAAAIGSLARLGGLSGEQLSAGLADPASVVRRRSAEEAVGLAPAARAPVAVRLATSLGDRDPLVVEAACWALGELAAPGSVEPLAATAGSHPDPRCREAAVAALGALGARGQTGGRAAVLEALGDRPSVRRRAVVALAAFEGAEVEAALRRSLEDRDWQVRQAAETLLQP